MDAAPVKLVGVYPPETNPLPIHYRAAIVDATSGAPEHGCMVDGETVLLWPVERWAEAAETSTRSTYCEPSYYPALNASMGSHCVQLKRVPHELIGEATPSVESSEVAPRKETEAEQSTSTGAAACAAAHGLDDRWEMDTGIRESSITSMDYGGSAIDHPE